MKTISEVFIILSLAFLTTQCEEETDLINIVDIPDDEFLNYLIEDGADTNGDGLISYSEASGVNCIDICGNGKISSLEGLKAFINLDTLHCCSNPIKDLDLSGNTELRVLIDWNSEDNDQLEQLNISNNTKLRVISIPGNKLASLDISRATELKRLWVDANQLTNLDVSNNRALLDLSCGINLLSNLDVSNCTKLERLYCIENELTELDISQNKALIYLGCGANEISSLDISENIKLDNIYMNDMPTLHKVCVWTSPFPPYWVSVDTTGSPNVNFTTDCSE
jgi:Leucine-rich repeat (LRR) protein